MAVHRLRIRQMHAAADARRPGARLGREQHAPRHDGVAFFRHLDLQRAALLQPPQHARRKAVGHVLNDDDAERVGRRQAREQRLDDARSARGRADRHDVGGRADERFGLRFFLREQLARAVDVRDDRHLRERLHLLHELAGRVVPAPVGHQRGLLDDVERARGDRVGARVRAFLVEERAEKQHRRRMARHDAARRFHAVHARHHQVHRDEIGAQRRRQLDRLGARRRLADDADLGIGVEQRRQHFARDGRVVHDEDADGRRARLARSGVLRHGCPASVARPIRRLTVSSNWL